MPPLISVIIPTSDRGYVLREAIDSVLAQTHDEVELIVVDDGSTDGTGDLIAEKYGSDPRVRYTYQSNSGVASARNAGLDLARGEYLAFLDSDDTWEPWHLRLMTAALAAHPEAGMAWTDMEAVDTDGRVISPAYLTRVLSAYRYFSKDDLFDEAAPLSDLGVDLPPGHRDGLLYVGDIFSQMLMGNLILTSTVVMTRDRLERVGRFDETLVTGEDYDFFMRVCREGPVVFADIADGRCRVGAIDRLSGRAMGLEIAKAYLRVTERTLALDAARITLSPKLIDTARAYGRAWVGEQYLVHGSTRLARAYLASALRVRLRQPRVVLLLGLAYLPGSIAKGLFRIVGGLRRASSA